MANCTEPYGGFEQGPIRPPSEAGSLLIRATRNCPWNRCTFCPVYKGSKFGKRPIEHILRDIELIHKYVSLLKGGSGEGNFPGGSLLSGIATEAGNSDELEAYNAALVWFRSGMESVFIQDANSLILKTKDLAAILRRLRDRFPEIRRITSYARSQTIARKSDSEMVELKRAGLNRIHIGLESGCDRVLEMVKKGATAAVHIEAGSRVKRAGIELSEYVMPGLGGRRLSSLHATETAETLNRIDPDFIRIRTLAIPDRVELAKEQKEGGFVACSNLEIVRELSYFIGSLEGISSFVRSDHILNLFQDLEGELPGDKEKMLNILKNYLELDPCRQSIYQLGSRMGLFRGLSDMSIPQRRERVERAARQLNVTPENIDSVLDEIVKRFI